MTVTVETVRGEGSEATEDDVDPDEAMDILSDGPGGPGAGAPAGGSNRKRKVRGPKGGIKHKSKTHNRKSKKQKQKRFRKKAQQKEKAAEQRKADAQKKWDSLTDEQKNLLPELNPANIK